MSHASGRFDAVRGPLIILGSNPVHLGEDALVEPECANISDLESLLAAKPRAAVITSGAWEGFFRASLCLERGVSRVVLRRGLFEEAWERELAARAATFGAELYVHDDTRGYGRVKPGARVAVGMPELPTWAADAHGLVMDAEWVERVRDARPLDMDPPIDELPSNLEEVAFANDDKPVLYLVVPANEVDALHAKYAGVTIVRREITLSVEHATGRRVYESDVGEKNAHVFVSKDAALARRAAQLWDEGSSRHALAIGELMGYPACCVAAFVALGERGNNAALTYVTAARSRALGAAFHAVLNSAVRHVIPCTPCSFGCTRAIAWAERVVNALPENVAKSLRRALARPVLYFDESRAIAFEGARVAGPMVEYESARFLPASAPLGPEEELAERRLFGALFAGSGKLFVKDDAFEVHARGEVRRLMRTGSRLGNLLPFGG
jgi:hypothetical protein